MTGIIIIIVLLVPIAFQVIMLAVKEERRDREIREILRRIEEKISK